MSRRLVAAGTVLPRNWGQITLVEAKVAAEGPRGRIWFNRRLFHDIYGPGGRTYVMNRVFRELLDAVRREV